MERYDSYKDSGVEWMKEVPSDWEFLRSRFLFNQRSSKNHPEEPLLSVTQERSLVRRDELETNVWNPDSNVSGYKLVKDGDFVISLRSFEGGLELSEVQGIVSPAYTVFYPIRRISSRYFKYLFKCHEFIIELNKYVSGIRQGKNISYSDFSEIYLPIPSLTCQEEIGEFLDRQTTLIDSLIEKTVRKIELLKEKRTTLINEVVTKGLNPDVEMKDSGVEWIGEIPNHWGKSKVKYHFETISKGTTPTTIGKTIDSEGDVRFIKGHNIVNGMLDFSTSHFIGIETHDLLSRSQLKANDILFVIAGTIGKCCLVDSNSVPANTSQAISFLRPNANEVPRFLLYVLGSEIVADQLSTLVVQSAQPNLSMEDLANLSFVYPPIHEQEQIVEYLDEQTSIIDSTISKEEKRIELLKEYRQSLISEVVTGKVKVAA